MKLFVGLGNPGARHAGNRHNVGYMAVDRIASDHGFPAWRSKFQGRACEGLLNGEKALLLKPETYMNDSGRSVAEAVRFFKLELPGVVVLHDELDLDPGRVKAKAGGGHAGHNGLKSIHRHLGADFVRVRIGIGHPGAKDLVTHYVLHDFARADREWLPDVLARISEAAPHLVDGGAADFMNRFGMLARVAAPASEGVPSGLPREASQAKEPGKTKGYFQKLVELLR